MAGFNNDFYSTGGLDFEASYSQELREKRGTDPMSQMRNRPQPRKPEPLSRQPLDTYSDGFDDDLGDYVPGSTVSGVRSPYAANSGRKSFDDDFDDDFGDFSEPTPIMPQPQQRSAAPPERRSRYDVYNDYDGSAFEAEFGGLRSIGGRKRRQEPEPQPAYRNPNIRSRYHEPLPEVSDDGYYAEASIADQPFAGQVPAIFAAYFDENYLAARQQTRNGKNKVNTYESRRRRRMLASLVSVLAIVVLSGTLAIYFSMFHVASPLKVKTALSSMSTDTSLTMIKQSVDSTLSQESFLVSVGGRNSSFQLSSYGFEYAKDQNAENEYIEVTDDKGNKSEQTITTVGSLRFNETLVKEFLYNVVGSEGVRMVEPSYNIDYEASAMTVKAGTNGYGIDYDSFITRLIDHIANNNSAPIECSMAETVAPSVDIDDIYSRVHCLVSDATKTFDGSGQVVYTPDVIGVDFDLNAARAQIAAGGASWNIGLVLTQPTLSLVELKAPDCPDLLATYYSEYNAGNKARSSNLALAAKFITEHGYLEPGDELSFNDTVGERTQERGFNKATVYSSEGTDEDYGGGICQTSSTLYYTCILANLEIIERHNHMYTVSYMTDTKRVQKFGNDATVNWGTADLKIKNNREYPIRIEFVCTTGKITCNIYGTWNGITADFGYAEQSVNNYKVEYRPAAPGKKNCAGLQGREVWTYRVVYQDGQEIDRYREAINKYIPLNEVRYTSNLPAGREYYTLY